MIFIYWILIDFSILGAKKTTLKLFKYVIIKASIKGMVDCDIYR